MPLVVINDTNHTGLIADISFTASTGPISSLGSHQIPYAFDAGSNDYFGTYELYYPQYNQTCQINYPPVLTFVVDTSVCSTFTFYIEGGSNFIMDIDWGDGSSIENFNSNNFYTPTHDYSPVQNIFTITITIDNPSTINAINSSAPYGYGCGNLLEIYNTNLLTVLTTVFLSNNKLSSNSINNLLIGLSGNGIGGGYAYLNNQTPPACPTGLGIDAQNLLVNVQGWLVQTDYFCEPLLEFVVDTNVNQTVYFDNISDFQNFTNFNLTIDWGDGTSPDSTTYTGNFQYQPTYYYSNLGVYTIKIGFSNKLAPTYIENYNVGNVIDINNFDILSNLYSINFANNRLSSSTINEILITLSGNGVSSGFVSLDNQTPPACPTGLGLQAYNHLVNNLGWFVDVYFCPFTSIWRTTSPNETIYLPIYNGGNYNFFVDWGDGNSETITSYTTNSHTYVSAGDYTVTITGLIDGWNFQLVDTSKDNIIEITSWGSLSLGNVGSYFSSCSNLILTGVTDTFDLGLTTNLTAMFISCFSLTSINNINSWNVSNVQDMSYMFAYSPFNQNISNWNVSGVTNMNSMFSNTTQFNQDISSWNVSGVTDMSNMFVYSPFNQDISSWNVSGVTNMIAMFANSPFNQDISSWNVSNVQDMSSMFEGTPFNQDISSWNVSGVTDMIGMFYNATQFNQDLSSWCVSQIPSLPFLFDGGASSWTGGTATRPQWGAPC